MGEDYSGSNRSTHLEPAGGYDQERKCLIKVANTFAIMLSNESQIGRQVQSIKKLLGSDEKLPLELVERELSKLKGLVVSQESDGASTPDPHDRLLALEELLTEACGFLRRMMLALFENFYPLNLKLKEMAETIDMDCRGDAAQMGFTEATGALLEFLEELKKKISKDFIYINSAFLLLLEQVKELEKSFAREFAGEEHMKKIEYFELKINQEVRSIAHSFDLYTTIDEIKNVVIEKIRNIKLAVSLRKKEDLKKAQVTQEKIRTLLGRISDAEKGAREMARKAEEFQMAAMKDGLTGLYNRKAFDYKVENALRGLREGSGSFSIILFDVDGFKEINDTLGHVAGDKVLKKVAECMRESFREDDFAARYGGDEFVVLIEKMSREIAREKILSFSRNLKKRRFFSYKKGEIDIQVSAGIATATAEDTPENLIERADKAMYAMKQTGKTDPSTSTSL
jgi:diguanylate cyclase (GGDEF)-like protein